MALSATKYRNTEDTTKNKKNKKIAHWSWPGSKASGPGYSSCTYPVSGPCSRILSSIPRKTSWFCPLAGFSFAPCQSTKVSKQEEEEEAERAKDSHVDPYRPFNRAHEVHEHGGILRDFGVLVLSFSRHHVWIGLFARRLCLRRLVRDNIFHATGLKRHSPTLLLREASASQSLNTFPQ